MGAAAGKHFQSDKAKHASAVMDAVQAYDQNHPNELLMSNFQIHTFKRYLHSVSTEAKRKGRDIDSSLVQLSDGDLETLWNLYKKQSKNFPQDTKIPSANSTVSTISTGKLKQQESIVVEEFVEEGNDNVDETTSVLSYGDEDENESDNDDLESSGGSLLQQSLNFKNSNNRAKKALEVIEDLEESEEDSAPILPSSISPRGNKDNKGKSYVKSSPMTSINKVYPMTTQTNEDKPKSKIGVAEALAKFLEIDEINSPSVQASLTASMTNSIQDFPGSYKDRNKRIDEKNETLMGLQRQKIISYTQNAQLEREVEALQKQLEKLEAIEKSFDGNSTSSPHQNMLTNRSMQSSSSTLYSTKSSMMDHNDKNNWTPQYQRIYPIVEEGITSSPATKQYTPKKNALMHANSKANKNKFNIGTSDDESYTKRKSSHDDDSQLLEMEDAMDEQSFQEKLKKAKNDSISSDQRKKAPYRQSSNIDSSSSDEKEMQSRSNSQKSSNKFQVKKHNVADTDDDMELMKQEINLKRREDEDKVTPLINNSKLSHFPKQIGRRSRLRNANSISSNNSGAESDDSNQSSSSINKTNIKKQGNGGSNGNTLNNTPDITPTLTKKKNISDSRRSRNTISNEETSKASSSLIKASSQDDENKSQSSISSSISNHKKGNNSMLKNLNLRRHSLDGIQNDPSSNNSKSSVNASDISYIPSSMLSDSPNHNNEQKSDSNGSLSPDNNRPGNKIQRRRRDPIDPEKLNSDSKSISPPKNKKPNFISEFDSLFADQAVKMLTPLPDRKAKKDVLSEPMSPYPVNEYSIYESPTKNLFTPLSQVKSNDVNTKPNHFTPSQDSILEENQNDNSKVLYSSPDGVANPEGQASVQPVRKKKIRAPKQQHQSNEERATSMKENEDKLQIWAPELDYAWTEVSLLLRKQIKTEEDMLYAVASAEAGIIFTDQMNTIAKSLHVLRGSLSRWLLPYDNNTRIETQCSTPHSVIDNMPDEFRGKLTERQVHYLVAGANGVRKLVRIKIADDNDLEQARTALITIDKFFKLLYLRSEHFHLTPFEILQKSGTL